MSYVSMLGLDLPDSCVLHGTAQMTDDEFWEHVYGGDRPDFEPEYHPDDFVGLVLPHPCPICGSEDACGYDQDGRPMIHSVDVDLDG